MLIKCTDGRPYTNYSSSLHRRIVHIPIAFFLTEIVCDVLSLISGNEQLATIAFYANGVGVFSAVFAALLGAVRWWSLPPKSSARLLGLGHAWLMVTATFAFSYVLLLRLPRPSVVTLAYVGMELAGGTLILLGALQGRRVVARLQAQGNVVKRPERRPSCADPPQSDFDRDIDKREAFGRGT